uniref:Sialic acid-binding lectin 1 n=1 Tax=Limacus flavus TaxID=36461 RepID=O76333_LIMFL|nr:sialic acid-binding lectin 1 [Limacus flavus]
MSVLFLAASFLLLASFELVAAQGCPRQDPGDWIVIQRRLNADVNFYRGWADYKHGFGDLRCNFWLGNEKIHQLTSHGRYKLRVEFTFNNKSYFAEYSTFKILGEADKYKLQVGGYSGNAGDALTFHNGMAFSTNDRDNDADSIDCAKVYHGAWWYKTCHESNLNGKWGSKKYGEGLNWKAKTTFTATATSSLLKIKALK